MNHEHQNRRFSDGHDGGGRQKHRKNRPTDITKNSRLRVSSNHDPHRQRVSRSGPVPCRITERYALAAWRWVYCGWSEVSCARWTARVMYCRAFNEREPLLLLCGCHNIPRVHDWIIRLSCPLVQAQLPSNFPQTSSVLPRTFRRIPRPRLE